MNSIRRFLCLVICLLIYFGEGINTSLMAPLFPPYAKNLGLNPTQIGLVQSMFNISIFFSQFLVASLVVPDTRKLYHVLGIFVSAVCVLLFGYAGDDKNETRFFWLCVVIRAMMGFGASCVYTCTIPVINSLYPKKIAYLNSFSQLCAGFGTMVGSTFGSALYHLGESLGMNGYSAPFYVCGAIELILSFLLFGLCPSSTARSQQARGRVEIPKGEIFRFVSKKSVMAVSIPAVSIFALSGFKDVALSPYFVDTIHVSEGNVGFLFLASTGAYMITAPLWGWVIQKGYVGHILTIAQFTSALVCFGYYIPKYISSLCAVWYIIIPLVLQGLSLSILFGSLLLVLEKAAEREGFNNLEMTKILVASWYSALRSMGRVVGSLFVGGVVLQYLDFYYTCLSFGILCFFLSFLLCVFLYKMDFYQKTFYATPEENLITSDKEDNTASDEEQAGEKESEHSDSNGIN